MQCIMINFYSLPSDAKPRTYSFKSEALKYAVWFYEFCCLEYMRHSSACMQHVASRKIEAEAEKTCVVKQQ